MSYVKIVQGSAPASPPSGYTMLYARTSDGKLVMKWPDGASEVLSDASHNHDADYAAASHAHAADYAAIDHTHSSLSDSGWLTPSLNAHWSTDAARPVRYRKVGKVVQITGALKVDSTSASYRTAFTLSAPYRPPYDVYVRVPRYDADESCSLRIEASSGDVELFQVDYSAAVYYEINATYLVD